MDFKRFINEGREQEKQIQGVLRVIRVLVSIILCGIGAYFVYSSEMENKLYMYIALIAVALSFLLESIPWGNIFGEKNRTSLKSSSSNLDEEISRIKASELAKQKLKK